MIIMWALIINNRVHELTDISPEGRFPAEMQWVACDSSVKEGWLYDGESFSEPETEAQEVTSCSPAQGLVALYAVKGITEADILSAIDSIPDAVQRYSAQIGYSRATTWEKESPTMQAMIALLGLSETEVDDLFSFAATVKI